MLTTLAKKCGAWTTISWDEERKAYRINCRKPGGLPVYGYDTLWVDGVDYELAQTFDPLESALREILE